MYKRVELDNYGSAEDMRITDVDKLPQPGEGEVLVKALAASVTYTDMLVRSGKYFGMKFDFPLTPGYDVVGEIVELGVDVTEFRVGQVVACLTVHGSYSEYRILNADNVILVPNEIDPVDAVSMVLSYVSAYQMLTREIDVQEGQTILIHGAGGAVGTAILQICNSLGITVVATASSAKQKLVEQLGGIFIDYRSEDFVLRIKQFGLEIDYVLNGISGSTLKPSLKLMKRGGKMVVYGFSEEIAGRGSVPNSFIKMLIWNYLPNGKRVKLYSIGSLKKKHPDWYREDLETLFLMLKNDKLKPEIWKEIKLDGVIDAHHWIEAAEVLGRIVIRF